METVANWEFEPATYQGQPVRCHLKIEVNFRLYDDGHQPRTQEPAKP